MPRESSVTKISDEPLSTKPLVVFLLLDGWGIAPEGDGNAIGHKNSKTFSRLLSEYPAGVLRVGELSETRRYQILGANSQFTSYLAEQGVNQIYLTESEKSSAVLGCFVGSQNIHKVENRIISSPVCDSYDVEPEMSLDELGRATVKVIRENNSGFILISIANLDLVSLSGNLEIVKKTVAKVDSFLGKITEEVLLKKGVLLISAAGGNVERMFDVRTELVDKESTSNHVPLLVVGDDFKGRSLFDNDAPGGDLSLLEPQGGIEDISATLLGLLNLKKPEGFIGKNLLEK
ncbi:MAG: hypothetical protein ACOYMB_00290 [Patescibacteria group bacterium]